MSSEAVAMARVPSIYEKALFKIKDFFRKRDKDQYKKCSLYTHAMRELDAIGMTEISDDSMNRAMRKHILHMVEEFAKEGHSGFSAKYAINILTNIMDYKPLAPLTGADDEWIFHDYGPGSECYQNKRCSHVFKDMDGRAYDINGIVFWEWYSSPEIDNGEPYKTYFTSRDSRVYIDFPYTPKTEYKEADPNR